jgi:Fe(3+) dicitrate transport protein
MSLNKNKDNIMFSRIFTIVLFIGLHLAGFSQKSTLVGKVTDNSKQVLIGANILLKGTVRGVQTNNNGEYIIKGLNAGDYTMVVSIIGLKTKEIDVKLLDNETRTIDFELEDETYTLKDVQIVARRGVRGNEHLAEVDGYSIAVRYLAEHLAFRFGKTMAQEYN